MNQPVSSLAAQPSRRWHDLGIRAISGIVLVAVALGTAWAGGVIFIALWLLAAFAVLWEWQRLIHARAAASRIILGWATLIFAAARCRAEPVEALLAVAVAAVVIGFFAESGRRRWAAAGMLYAGALVLPMILLRFSVPFGARAIFWLFATVWATDTFAYIGGRLIGGPKLSPRISPSKTWAGTLVGLLAGSATGTGIGLLDMPDFSGALPIFAVTLVVSLASQVGDAVESAVKRRFGVKDSSRLIPGHGGAMDRLDGFIAAAALAVCIGLSRDSLQISSGLFHWR